MQSLAPAAWQMASASVKVLSRAHCQSASDSPHTEQPGLRDPQAGESWTSEQQRTCGRKWGRREHIHTVRPRALHSMRCCTAYLVQFVRVPAEPCSLGAGAGPPTFDRHGRYGWRRDAPHQLKVKQTPSACGAAVQELGSGAEPRAYGLADGLGLGEGLVTCARPARFRRSPHRAARPTRAPGLRELDVGAAANLWTGVGSC